MNVFSIPTATIAIAPRDVLLVVNFLNNPDPATQHDQRDR